MQENTLRRVMAIEEQFGAFFLYLEEEKQKAFLQIYDPLEAYRLKIILNEVVIRGEFNPKEACFSAEIVNEEGFCYLRFRQQQEGKENLISLFFSDISEEVMQTGYTKSIPCGVSHYHPWQKIAEFAYCAEQKIIICGADAANEEEHRLAELAQFIPLMVFWGYTGEKKDEIKGTERFLSFLKETGKDRCKVLCKLEETVEKYKKEENPRERNRLQREIYMQMRKQETMPVFTLIFNAFHQAAKDYVSLCEAEFGSEKIGKVRENIHTILHSQGYVGNYPNYYKPGQLKGLHLVKGNDDTQLIWNEKEVGMYLNVVEEYSAFPNNDNMPGCLMRLTIQCGRVIYRKKKASEITDYRIEAGFYEQGYKSIRNQEMVVSLNTEENFTISLKDVERIVHLAVKTVECKKIRKEETQGMPLVENAHKSDSFLGHMLGGAIFGLLMSLISAMVLMILFCISTGSITQAAAELPLIPWKWVFFGTGISFGGIMYLLSKKAK